MRKRTAVAMLVTLAATTGARAAEPQQAAAFLEPRSGSQVRGSVIFAAAGDRVRISATVSGLKPGAHGFHIHEAGDCSAPDAASAKGHFNPAGKPHGNPAAGGEHHLGDLPSLTADGDGNARFTAELAGVTLAQGPTGLGGRSVVVHADADDYTSQPAGNSGARVACGVILTR